MIKYGFLILFLLLTGCTSDSVDKVIRRNYTKKINNRSYNVHLPIKYNNEKLPVVVVLHGGGGHAAYMPIQTGFDSIADRENFIVVYPNASNFYWNAGVPPLNEAQKKVDDVKFIKDVLDDLAKDVSIDVDRLYCCGMSNGSHMTFKLASETTIFAAVGGVAGQRTVGQYSSMPSRKVPLIYFHGTKDFYMPFDGRKKIKYGNFEIFEAKPVFECVLSWVKFNGDSPLFTTTTKGKATQYSYEEDVVFWKLEDGGHTWPGGKKSKIEDTAGVGNINMDISASELMWEFFKKYKNVSR